jgi:hypothetical protein
MATESRNTGLPEFFADTRSVENIQREFIEAPLERARQLALSSSLELGTLLSILPGAFVASQHRELERVKASGGKDDPRIAALRTSIEYTNILQTSIQRGQARARRVLVALADKGDIFHGFVSDAEFVPLKGLKVRLVDTSNTRGTKMLTAMTNHDGYFRIPFETKSDAEAGQLVSRVEILKKGKLVHTDPVLLAWGQGSAYREYVISTGEPPSASDFREFMSAAKQRRTRTDVPSSEKTTKRSVDTGSAKRKPRK